MHRMSVSTIFAPRVVFVPIGSSVMGLSSQLGGWGESRHFTGLDRPALQQMSESAKGDDVCVFHGAYFSPRKPINANQLCGASL